MSHLVTITKKSSTRIGQRRPAVEASCSCWASQEFKSFDQAQNVRDANTWRSNHHTATN
jgi:hypothetical protein